jgi:fumarate reductase flavoprotein subunit
LLDWLHNAASARDKPSILVENHVSTACPEQEDNMSESTNIQADVAVLGSGVAGLAAAVAAAEKGASVVLFEKNNALGGRSVRAEGFFAADSPAQQRFGIDAPADVLFKMAMDYAHWRINPRIMRAFINKSGDTVRWLESKGCSVDRITPFYRNQIYRVWHQPKGGGAEVISVLSRDCEQLGVKVLTGTPAKKILTDRCGRIAGLIAVIDGTNTRIDVTSVIIATGGFGGNKELLMKYSPDYSEDINTAAPVYSGDGLLMAMELGAANEGLGTLHMSGPRFDGSDSHVAVMCQEPDVVWVNIKGERFADETLAYNHYESINTVLQQPRKRTFSLFDEKIKQRVTENGPYKIRQGVYYGIYKEDMANLSHELEKQAELGRVKISESWDGIASWIGTSPGVLKATIEKYNFGCEHGYDEDFFKDRRFLLPLTHSPFYALRCRSGIIGTIGGIKINHRMEVINREDEVIPGLYAAGTDAGGWESDTYNVHLSATTFGFPLNSGRIAGENAALFVSKK